MMIWTIYAGPTDYPGKFVARPHFVGNGWTCPLAHRVVADNLAEIRKQMIALGLVRMERSDGDDPAIVETWL